MLQTHFVIEVPTLIRPSRKPKHLDSRLKSKTTHHHHQQDEGALRKQVFIAARKHKLSLRSAHVVSVQSELKHKLDKEKNERIASLKETLASAERKRKLRLQTTIVQNHEHVEKAKGIAKNHHQRLVEEKIGLKKSIDHRLRMSASRRTRLAAMPRSRLLDPTAWEWQNTLDIQDESACLIQNWYRQRKFEPIAKIYRKIGLSREKATKLSMLHLTQRVQSEVVIKATGYVINRAKRMFGKSVTFKNPARVLLSSFMLHVYPKETLMSMDAQEEVFTIINFQDLAQLSGRVITDLDLWMGSTTSAVIAPLARKFLETFTLYYAAFEAWKSKDTLKIVDELIGHFMELDQIWVSVVGNENALDEWAPATEEQQSQHLRRIKKFGGDAMTRLDAVRKEFHEHVLASGVDVVINTLADPFGPAHEMYRARVHRDSLVQAVEDEITSPISPTTRDLTESFGHLLSNQQLAHELVMDPEFKLAPNAKEPLEERVTMMAKKALQDSISAEVQEGVYGIGVMGLLGDIREGLMSMVNEKGPVSKEIAEVFDMEFLQTQIRNKVFDLRRVVGYAGEKMLQLCAPVRDAEIRAIAQEGDITAIIFKMLQVLEGMKIDLANFRLQALKPELKKQAVEYEKLKFDHAIRAGAVTLEKTDMWLKKATSELQKVADERNPENIDHPDLKLKFGNVYNHALLSILFSTTPIEPSTLAETLIMDGKRLFEMQNELQAMTIVAALTMLSKNIIPELRTEFSAMKELSAALFTMLRSEGTTLATLSMEIVSCANIVFHKHTKLIANLSHLTSKPEEQKLKEVSPEQETLIQSMVEKTLSHKDPFFSVLSRRIERLVRVALEKDFKKEALKKNGLDLIENEFEPLVNKICILARHNRAVYNEHYDSILNKYVL